MLGAELGLAEKLHWRSSRMAYFVDGGLYPFLTPLDLLRFRPLPLLERLRAGLALKRAQRAREEDIAPQKAVEWLTALFGARAFRVIWEPLMRFKFARYAPEISAAWIWARSSPGWAGENRWVCERDGSCCFGFVL